MSVTFAVLKLDRSSAVSASQPVNMEYILVTFCVLKLETFKLVSTLQPENVDSIVATFDVSKSGYNVKSKFAKAVL